MSGRIALVLAILVVPASIARADDDEMHASPHTEESEVLIGVKVLGLGEYVDRAELDAMRMGGGAGAYLEFSVVPSWIELELGLAVAHAEGETFVTLEPLAKKNLHLDERLDLYLGLGPVIGVAVMENETLALVGGLAVLGAYVWIDEWIGIDLELTGQLAWAGDPAAELAIGLGPVLRV